MKTELSPGTVETLEHVVTSLVGSRRRVAAKRGARGACAMEYGSWPRSPR